MSLEGGPEHKFTLDTDNSRKLLQFFKDFAIEHSNSELRESFDKAIRLLAGVPVDGDPSEETIEAVRIYQELLRNMADKTGNDPLTQIRVGISDAQLYFKAGMIKETIEALEQVALYANNIGYDKVVIKTLEEITRILYHLCYD